MAKNTGDGYRKGSVNDRTQFHNPHNDTYGKRNTETGRIMAVKPDTPYKGIAKETDNRRK